MSSPRKLTPQEETRLAQVRKNFQEKRRVTELLEGIGTRIGVYSGKGGVGKTTVATNLAVTLATQKKDVALFDCDIDCPNVTRVLRITEGPGLVQGLGARLCFQVVNGLFPDYAAPAAQESLHSVNRRPK